MDWRLRVPSAIYRLALARAGSDRALADLAVRWLTRYAQGEALVRSGVRLECRQLVHSRQMELRRPRRPSRVYWSV